jgi:hypothetical protein
MKIPSIADWGEIDNEDLDAAWAFKQFSGKSLEEAEALFQSNALCYQEDLQSMPATAFNFYAPALVKYLTSERAAGDPDGASSFLHMVIWMLKTRRDIIAPETEKLLVSATEHIAKNQVFYDADVGIYGQFPSLYAEVLSLSGRRA